MAKTDRMLQSTAKFQNKFSRLKELKQDYPLLYQALMEGKSEMDSYKKNERAYRLFMEKFIVKSLIKMLPSKLELDIDILFKAKNFMSGDFCYSGKYADSKFMVWLGDSISHGTGSLIVKEIINETINQVYNYFKVKKDYNITNFTHRVQNEFSAPRTVRKIMEADLSDIIESNDDMSKMGITIPIVFTQMEKHRGKIRIRIVNKGMPLVLLLRIDPNTGDPEKCYFISRKDVFHYNGKYAEYVECIDHSGIPLILDRDLFNSYTENTLSRRKLKRNKTNIKGSIFNFTEIMGRPGDLIVIPSDGVLDIYNQQHELYDIDRFIDDIMNFSMDNMMSNLPMSQFKEKFYQEKIRPYCVWNDSFPISGNGIEDDMTILFMKLK